MNKSFNFNKYTSFSFQAPFDFSKNSSIGCGGFATAVFYPHNVEELLLLIRQLKQDGIRYYVLGNLTNVLPPDDFTNCVVVSTKRMDTIAMGNKMFVGAGVSSGALLRACKQRKRLGVEFLSGIPCTIGGALYMNAGADGRYISDIVESVVVLREEKRCILPLEQCDYRYKHSLFMENEDIILGASLHLEKGAEEEIEEKEKYYLARRQHLPKGRSMGCVFKNPDGAYAGELIERSGLKGLRVGGVKISEEHANFIINDKGATSRDIKGLIALIKNAVLSQYGISLEEEIRYLK